MIIHIQIHDYCKENGLQLQWEAGSVIKTTIGDDNTVSICANQEGLISLARHFLTLAQENVPVGYHLHFDQFNAFEDNSAELIVEKVLSDELL